VEETTKEELFSYYYWGGGFKSRQLIYEDYTYISLEKHKKPFTILSEPKKT
jgi:hypothetical protein